MCRIGNDHRVVSQCYDFNTPPNLAENTASTTAGPEMPAYPQTTREVINAKHE